MDRAQPYPILHHTVPAEGRAALAWARQFYPDAFIAGGYLRDVYQQQSPKDIDIFTFVPEMREGGRDLMDTNGVSPEKLAEIYDVDRLLFAETPVEVPGCAVPVQIVHLNADFATSPADAVSQFMVGMAQVWSIDGEKIMVHPAFHDDALHHRFTVTRARSAAELFHTMRKVTCLVATKYPGHSLVIPAEFLALIHPDRREEEMAEAADVELPF